MADLNCRRSVISLDETHCGLNARMLDRLSVASAERGTPSSRSCGHSIGEFAEILQKEDIKESHLSKDIYKYILDDGPNNDMIRQNNFAIDVHFLYMVMSIIQYRI